MKLLVVVLCNLALALTVAAQTEVQSGPLTVKWETVSQERLKALPLPTASLIDSDLLFVYIKSSDQAVLRFEVTMRCEWGGAEWRDRPKYGVSRGDGQFSMVAFRVPDVRVSKIRISVISLAITDEREVEADNAVR